MSIESTFTHKVGVSNLEGTTDVMLLLAADGSVEKENCNHS